MILPCGHASSVGSSTATIKNNRFARCLGASEEYPRGSGGAICTGVPLNTAGKGGYYPDGGYYARDASVYTGTGWVWEGNFWDNNLEAVQP